MGKTLAKARKKAAKAVQEQGQNGAASTSGGPLAAIAKRLKYKLPSNPKKKLKLVPIISEAMNAKAWDDAQQLFDMLEHRLQSGDAEVPKLGAIMRWVRAADLAGTEAIAARLLASIMRVSSGPQPLPAATPAAATGASAPSSSGDHSDQPNGESLLPVRRFPPWRPPSAPGNSDAATAAPPTSEAANASDPSSSSTDAAAPSSGRRSRFGPYAGRYAVVPLPAEYAGTNANSSSAANAAAAAPPGATTLLPNIARDVTMFCTEPGTIRFETNRPPVQRAEAPFVPGAFALLGVLSRDECEQIVTCAEEMGYTVDPDYTFSAAARAAAAAAAAAGTSAGAGLSGSSAARSGGVGLGERGAAGCVWLADESLQGPIYDRVSHLLPQSLCGGDLAGINCRWRLYRYDKGSVYRPHVDGAWPGSGLRNGRYEFDAYGDRWSRLTFLVYLNDDFEGGSTTFYTPAPQGSGACIEAHSIKPVAGNIMVFPHGDTMGSLVHEGAAVTRGSKYVIRTEVLYKLAPGVRGGGAGAPQPAMAMPSKGGAAT